MKAKNAARRSTAAAWVFGGFDTIVQTWLADRFGKQKTLLVPILIVALAAAALALGIATRQSAR